MATAPLFVADLPTLKTKLRLSGVSDDPSVDASAMIDESILAVRTKFYARLGITKVAALVAITFVPAPSTEPEILRAVANTCEVNMVRLELMDRLPWLWSDSSGEAQKAWNEEAPFREKGSVTFQALREELMQEIEEALSLLEGSEVIGEEQGIKAFDGRPECPAPQIGRTLRRFGCE